MDIYTRNMTKKKERNMKWYGHELSQRMPITWVGHSKKRKKKKKNKSPG